MLESLSNVSGKAGQLHIVRIGVSFLETAHPLFVAEMSRAVELIGAREVGGVEAVV